MVNSKMKVRFFVFEVLGNSLNVFGHLGEICFKVA